MELIVCYSGTRWSMAPEYSASKSLFSDVCYRFENKHELPNCLIGKTIALLEVKEKKVHGVAGLRPAI